MKRDNCVILHKNSPMCREDQISSKLYFQVKLCFLENFELVTCVFYSIMSDFNYFRPKGCWFFNPVFSCLILLLIINYCFHIHE